MQVSVKEFTGPLDLLLQLVRREEMDIFDINIHKITDQYLYVLTTHSIPDLHSAGDFIKIAATLIYIKSANLFPSESEDNCDADAGENLKSALVQSLLQIQRLQHIAKTLNQRFLLGRDVWAGGNKINKELPPQQVKSSSKIFLKLLKAYYRIMTYVPATQHFNTEEALPVLSDCIQSLHPCLVSGTSLKMSSLFDRLPKKGNIRILIIFLSLLELNRLGIVSLYQNSDFSDIIVSVKKSLKQADLSFIEKEFAAGENRIGELA